MVLFYHFAHFTSLSQCEISKKCYKPGEYNNSFMLLHMSGQSIGRISDKFAQIAQLAVFGIQR